MLVVDYRSLVRSHMASYGVRLGYISSTLKHAGREGMWSERAGSATSSHRGGELPERASPGVHASLALHHPQQAVARRPVIERVRLDFRTGQRSTSTSTSCGVTV